MGPFPAYEVGFFGLEFLVDLESDFFYGRIFEFFRDEILSVWRDCCGLLGLVWFALVGGLLWSEVVYG